MHRFIKTAIVAAILLTSARAAAEPVDVPVPTVPTRVLSPSVLTTEKSRVVLPPDWWIVPPDKWETLDGELHRLQDRETRLTAENESMRSSLHKFDRRWIYVAGSALVAGMTIGFAGKASVDTVRGWF